MKFVQDDRPIAVETPLGKDELVLTSFSGEEQMSRLFTFDLQLLADNEKKAVDPQDIVGKRVDFFVRNAETGEPRYFNGFVSWFCYSGAGDRGHMYQAQVVPWLWFLTQSSECRVYETKKTKTFKDVVEQVFRNYGFTDFEWKVKRQLEKREFCVQYNETHFAFVSRMLEHEGISYYFKHEKGKHTLVLIDNPGACPDCPNDFDVTLLSNLAQPELTDKISTWNHEYRFTTGKWAHTDYNFETPSTDLEAKTNSVLKTTDISKFEKYEYSAKHLVKAEGTALAKMRIEGEEAKYDVVSGTSVCRDFSTGFKFKLSKHHTESEAGKEWILTAVHHEASAGGGYVPGVTPSSEIYSNSFRCIPASTPFRPERITPLPKIRGIQTARVVGPAGEEIFTDENGRVKVRFHWDRESPNNETSSFWVRVAYPWTGKNWGMVSIPRIGQEVIIDFLDGDPDRPVLTGMVYNSETMPPYPLPDNKTQSGTKTRSTPKGSADNFNELRFEDKKGEEEIYVHAEKDFNCVIENNETRKVGFDDKDKGDQTTEIYNDQNLQVGVGSGKGNQTIEVEQNRTVTVNKGDDTLEVKQGDVITIVGRGDYKHDVKLGKATMTAMKSIELKCGGSSIKIEPAKITLKAVQILIDASAKLDAKAGGMTTVEAGGITAVKGALVKIN